MVDEAQWSLVHAEAALAKAGLARGRPYPGTYRMPGQFAARNLRGLNAQGLILRRFNFAGADLRAADFFQADLRGADLRGADLRDAVLLSTRLESALVDERTRLPISESEARARGVTSWSERR